MRLIETWSLGLFLLLLFLGLTLRAEEAGQAVYFGKKESTEAALIGILYDLKQDQQRNSLKWTKATELMGQFLRAGWDEALLNKFYRVTKPLYATQVFIPQMDADSAPAAFGVQDTVKPRNWLIHYKGQVSPPKAGRFRFLGGSDDFMAVAINQTTVLIANHPQIDFENPGWKGVREDPWVPNGRSVKGDWFTAKPGEIMDIDIIVGEIPGGSFGAWLFIEQEGVKYEERKGQMVPTIFQVARRTFDLKGDLPAYADMPEPWICHQ
ncbi:MAG: hypothetical protein HC904_06725 [Blastochloris sp.]|nr:hypothetical protein [Blastochloris sp.]